MDDFIRREVAIQKIRDTDYDVVHRDGDNGFSFLTVVRVLHEVPAAEVAPVVHGKWIEEPVAENISMVKCSACRKYPEKKGQCFTQYCCLCGAKMDL